MRGELVYWLVLLGLVVGGFAACERSHGIVKDPEALESLKVAKEIFVHNGLRVIRLCDEGNLVYFTSGSHASDVEVIEGGCQ